MQILSLCSTYPGKSLLTENQLLKYIFGIEPLNIYKQTNNKWGNNLYLLSVLTHLSLNHQPSAIIFFGQHQLSLKTLWKKVTNYI